MTSRYQVDLAEGFTKPLQADSTPPVDAFSSSGAYQPTLKVLDVKNALPTNEGYISAFNKESQIGAAIPGDIQSVFSLRTFTGIPLLIAYTKQGLWACGTADPTAEEELATESVEGDHVIAISSLPAGFAWTKVAESPMGAISPWGWWTHAVVTNKIYFYQQGLGYILQITDDGTTNKVLFKKYNPTFIIGTYKVKHWQVRITVDTDATPDATQEIGLTDHLSLLVTGTDKTHIVADLHNTWKDRVSMLWGMGGTIE